MSKYIRVAEYKFSDAIEEAKRMGIPYKSGQNYIEFDMSKEPVSENNCICNEARSARAYLRQVREIRKIRSNR